MNSLITIDPAEVAVSYIRAQGPGGQNVNKVSSAVHLRFDIRASSLPQEVKDRLLASSDARITTEGVLVIKAQSYRTQEMNREDAMNRLTEWVNATAHVAKKRRPTKPTFGSRQRRLQGKAQRSELKATRSKKEI